MSHLIKRCATSLWSSLPQVFPGQPTQQSTILSTLSYSSVLAPNCNNLGPVRALFTSPVLQFKTKKRRKRYPFFWLQDKYRAYYDEHLTPQNEEFFQQFLNNKYNLSKGSSPLKSEPWNVNETFTEGTARTGVIARKLGTFPMWTKQGVRLSSTLLMVTDNHVINYKSPEEFQRTARPVDRKRYEGKGCIIVGADSQDPRKFTAEYNGLFTESGVMPKKKLTRFIVTHNSRIEPGTPLLASHFRPGMYVDVYGKSIEWGKQGVRFRYKLKLGNKTHGTTKAHNRIGSIGRGRKWCGPLKGRKMPGHHGGERVILPGLKIWRINTKYNLIYVHGPSVPGKNGDYVNIMDSRMPKKTLTVDSKPPFPTCSLEENSKLDEELYDEQLHNPLDPSIIFEITEKERRERALASRLGKAKTAQKIR